MTSPTPPMDESVLINSETHCTLLQRLLEEINEGMSSIPSSPKSSPTRQSDAGYDAGSSSRSSIWTATSLVARDVRDKLKAADEARRQKQTRKESLPVATTTAKKRTLDSPSDSPGISPIKRSRTTFESFGIDNIDDRNSGFTERRSSLGPVPQVSSYRPEFVLPHGTPPSTPQSRKRLVDSDHESPISWSPTWMKPFHLVDNEKSSVYMNRHGEG
ncbi:hypothetical protein BU24DRAFT_497214 [Aaosphaeria arxii CBS 175.79]|uniref:Uncharacterized protein n=1 Tax=Aaosphaeria arxii CBS 175.79 TaxID=1450172 RepID=A0A6A5X9T5_9PLEO|nr:uncharacterized protein BU24DRAFT_497214 [Aaosphaeria arxii CBS 175.79]KAF2009626.1 hypothetical protein BU24DRAFT_497214 [Aaosphaeria arxii CBS 175.79]